MATVYWFGGTGNWSDQANHWSNNSGNSPASLHGAEPGTDDDVVFDANSASDNYTVTVDTAAGTRTCQNITVDKPTGVGKKVTINGSSSLNIYGNTDMVGGTAGVTLSFSGITYWKATSGTKTFKSYGLTFYFIYFNPSAGVTYQILDDIKCTALYCVTGSYDFTTYTTTVTLTYGINNNAANPTYYNLTCSGVSFTGGINASATIANIFKTVNGNDSGHTTIYAPTTGTPITITAHATDIAYADFRDIIGAGDATWDLSASSTIGDCGGNSDITFPTPVDQHWTNVNGGNWATGANWTSRVPLPQDDVYMDCAFGTSKTVTSNAYILGKSVDWTGATWTTALTWAIGSTTSVNVHGSLTMIDNLTLSLTGGGVINFFGRDSYTFHPHSLTFDRPITLNAIGGTLTLKGDLTIGSTRILAVTRGTLTCVDGVNNRVISAGFMNIANSASATLTLGSATHSFAGATGNIWAMGAAGVISANTSTIKLTGALTAHIHWTGSKDYNGASVWNATTNAYELIIDGSNTFNDFKIDAGREVNFTNSTTQTVTTFTALGTSGSHIVIHNTSSTTHAILAKAGGGVISGCDYIDIQEMTGSPASTWYIGANSTDTGTTCTNIYLSVAPTTNIKSYNTNLRANIKSINTNLIANVKTLNTNA